MFPFTGRFCKVEPEISRLYISILFFLIEKLSKSHLRALRHSQQTITAWLLVYSGHLIPAAIDPLSISPLTIPQQFAFIFLHLFPHRAEYSCAARAITLTTLPQTRMDERRQKSYKRRSKGDGTVREHGWMGRSYIS